MAAGGKASKSGKKAKASMRTVPAREKSRKEQKAADARAELLSAASLLQEAEGRLHQAKEKEAEAEAAFSATFPRRLALVLKETGRMTVGTKAEIKELLREFDANGDGRLQKIELRQMVRNKLGMKEDNGAIDSFFESIDEDNSGEIDFDELTAACHHLLEVHQVACEEREDIHEQIERLRKRAELLRAAAESTQELEAEEKRRAEEEGAAVEAPPAAAPRQRPSGSTAATSEDGAAPANAPAPLRSASRPVGKTGKRVGSDGRATIDPFAALQAKVFKLQAAVRNAAEGSFVRHEQSFAAREAAAKAAADRKARMEAAKAAKKAAAEEKLAAEKKAFDAKVEARRKEKTLEAQKVFGQAPINSQSEC